MWANSQVSYRHTILNVDYCLKVFLRVLDEHLENNLYISNNNPSFEPLGGKFNDKEMTT
jgi:hypothetical protein